MKNGQAEESHAPTFGKGRTSDLEEDRRDTYENHH